MNATISADIVSSTSLSIEETVGLKQRIESLFSILEDRYAGFWGRQIKGDYIECVIPNPSDAFRIALILKTCLKSFEIKSSDDKKKLFQTYGVRIAIGIGNMRLIDRNQDIMDGEAIYLSGRKMESIGSVTKGTLFLVTNIEDTFYPVQTVCILTDALVNNATRRQSEVLYYKLLRKQESEIADLLGVKQAGVNQHSTLARWYAIDSALAFFEQVKFNDYE